MRVWLGARPPRAAVWSGSCSELSVIWELAEMRLEDEYRSLGRRAFVRVGALGQKLVASRREASPLRSEEQIDFCHSLLRRSSAPIRGCDSGRRNRRRLYVDFDDQHNRDTPWRARRPRAIQRRDHLFHEVCVLVRVPWQAGLRSLRDGLPWRYDVISLFSVRTWATSVGLQKEAQVRTL